MERFLTTHSMQDLLDLINWIGILPFFPNSVPGFSVEESVEPGLLWSDQPGPWEWKGPMIQSGACLYGKLIGGRAAFVSREWFPDLANYRRDGYDFEGRCDDGLVPYRDKQLMTYLEQHAPCLSKTARKECGVTKGYDGVLTRLEMQTFITNHDFVYSVDKHGRTYGWGNAVLTTPERLGGEEWVNSADSRTPGQSLERMAEHLHACMPDVSHEQLKQLLKA